MTCPVCGGKTFVSNSRATVDSVYRERTCKDCAYKFYTCEDECKYVEFESVLQDYFRKIKQKRKLNV